MLRPLRRALHVHGVSGIWRQGRRWLHRRRHPLPPDRFDLEWGVETDGRELDAELALSDPRHGLYASRAQPTAPEAFCALLHAAQLPPGMTFLDVGCGKGRALMLASLYPFQRIIGVECGKGLVETARANLSRWQHPAQQCRNLTVEWADATTYPLPLDPLVLYLFHPFARPVMDRFVSHVADSLRSAPRPCLVLYSNPRCGEAWTEAGFETVATGPRWAIYRL